MINDLSAAVLTGIQTINQILTAGIAVTAFSLFLYSLSFNLRDRVAKSFALILLCVVVVFTAEALQDNSQAIQTLDMLMRLQWFGIIFLPAAYLHLSDALLVTAGKPSRGRRRIAVRLMYAVASIFLLLLATGNLLGEIVPNGKPAPYLQRTLWTEIFTLFYITAMIWAAINFFRAYRLMLTRFGRRRMIYLMAGATAPALGSFPYLMFGYSFAAQHQFIFWGTATLINIIVAILIVVMAYAVAFFGVSWPDRVIKSRLFKWIMRGPVTASAALAFMTVVRRGGEFFGTPYNAFVPFTVVATILLMEHAITFAAPLWERWLFFGRDRKELLLLQNIEERLLTQGDLQQFLEAILAAVRDHLQSPAAFVASLNDETLSPIIVAGNRSMLDQEGLTEALSQVNGDPRREFQWGNFWILPLFRRRTSNMDLDET
ncbi:MAG: histidine kinase N-terminal 7TM domain-containing protein, partial [Anaerolineales bacterium]